MSKDEQLLMLAAKAEGREPPIDSNGVWSAWVGSAENGHWWNPLEDDGDALRLAVTLEIGVMSKSKRDSCELDTSVAITPYSVSQKRITEKHKGDPVAATRRAIVRAAAEIAKATA